MMPSVKAILADAKEALSQLPPWERGFHLFWLLGPFILLIERTPADIWLSILALAFVVRSLVKRDGAWLNVFWVKAGFVFWLWCLFAAAISSDPSYALGEAVVWFRFPLFAMATAFWLAKDKRLLYAMLMSTAAGLIVMCGILTAEILIVGQQHNRLSWPYGDLTPGNYVAKVGLPVFTIMVALAVSVKGRVAGFSSLIALFTVLISVMTGERINFLIRACGGMLAGLVWKPKWNRYLLLVVMEVLAVVLVLTLEPDMAKRYTDEFIAGAFYFETSGWMHAMNGGYLIGLDNPIVGIGTANFRNMAPILLEGVPYTQIQPHPHNYYVQMFCETGLIGLALGSLFLWAIVGSCFKSSFKNRNNVVLATSWVIPFGLFWPIATSADFFGQWNNIFMWSAVALAVAANNLVPKTD
jgi:hypothetical protein